LSNAKKKNLGYNPVKKVQGWLVYVQKKILFREGSGVPNCPEGQGGGWRKPAKCETRSCVQGRVEMN